MTSQSLHKKPCKTLILQDYNVYFGRGALILKEREKLKKIERRNEYQKSKLLTKQKMIYL
jgi:hypothetical protein